MTFPIRDANLPGPVEDALILHRGGCRDCQWDSRRGEYRGSCDVRLALTSVIHLLLAAEAAEGDQQAGHWRDPHGVPGDPEFYGERARRLGAP